MKWDVEASTQVPSAISAAGFIVVQNGPDKSVRNDEWSAYTVWGVEVVKGERRYVRHIHFESPTLTKVCGNGL